MSPNEGHPPAPSGSGVRVKALEWQPTSSGFCWHAASAVGRFFIEERHSDFRWSVEGWPGEWAVNTLDHAKAAAQADYEARILSALASDASPRGDADGGEPMPDRDGADGTERLCRALYGRKAQARDYLGGSDARMLHDAADHLARADQIKSAAQALIAGACLMTTGFKVSNSASLHCPLRSTGRAQPMGFAMDDVVKRLLEYAQDWRIRSANARLPVEAANEIIRLRTAHSAPATVEMREALEEIATQPIVDGVNYRALVRKLVERAQGALAPATEGRKG